MKLFSSIVPYLLLASFYSGPMNNFDLLKINSINKSPYMGVAVSLVGNSDNKEYEKEDFDEAVDFIKRHTKKHVWPWIFFNRFIGYDIKYKKGWKNPQRQYFTRIKGMDLYNETGDLGAFYDLWEISLSIAKDLAAPGIVVDPEAYHDFRAYRLSYISHKMGKPEEAIKERLKEIGKELVDIADRVYPEAIIWFFFTGLDGKHIHPTVVSKRKYKTVTYIIKGMLERAKEKKSKLRFVSGGESSLGYCYESLHDLRESIEQRNGRFADLLVSYPMLSLGGTIAPWNNSEQKENGYFNRRKCLKSKCKDINDFKPLIGYLLKSHDYVWIYAAKAVGYDPYNSETSRPYNYVIDRMLSRIQQHKDGIFRGK